MMHTEQCHPRAGGDPVKNTNIARLINHLFDWIPACAGMTRL